MKKFNTLFSAFITYYLPKGVYRCRRDEILNRAKRNPIVADRLDYYCKLADTATLPTEGLTTVGSYRFPYFERHRYSFYFMDLYRVVKYFPSDCRFDYLFGDIIHEPPHPTLVKSRQITDQPTNAVLLKWDSLRHFNFITDRTNFVDKSPLCIMRNLWANDKRARFLDKYLNDPAFDLSITKPPVDHPEWNRGYMSIAQQLRHRYILCLEGNDVATNLKWVMSSNSIAVMPTPEYETWYMEGRLIPDVHYIQIADDYSDVADKLRFYDRNPEAARKIIDAQHQWVDRFRDPAIELMTEIAVADRYFRLTN